MAVLPVVVLLACGGAQALVLVRQQAQAQADARGLARQAVVCHPGGEPAPTAIDPALGGGEVEVSRGPTDVVVTVRLAPATLIPGLPGGIRSPLAPQARVAMRTEPC